MFNLDHSLTVIKKSITVTDQEYRWIFLDAENPAEQVTKQICHSETFSKVGFGFCRSGLGDHFKKIQSTFQDFRCGGVWPSEHSL